MKPKIKNLLDRYFKEVHREYPIVSEDHDGHTVVEITKIRSREEVDRVIKIWKRFGIQAVADLYPNDPERILMANGEVWSEEEYGVDATNREVEEIYEDPWFYVAVFFNGQEKHIDIRDVNLGWDSYLGKKSVWDQTPLGETIYGILTKEVTKDEFVDYLESRLTA